MLTNERREELGELAAHGAKSPVPAECFAGAILEALLSINAHLEAHRNDSLEHGDSIIAAMGAAGANAKPGKAKPA